MRRAGARPSTGKRFVMRMTAIAVILAYPVALVIVRSTPIIRQAITVIVIAPLVASIVVRTYGW
jgi:putative spermidine/putrescine transport system permease protein